MISSELKTEEFLKKIYSGHMVYTFGKEFTGIRIESLAIMKTATKELQQIPGVGKRIASDLYGLGIRSVKDLKNKNPEELYIKLCKKQGMHVDRCVLYVFRCAVYFASHTKHNPELLKWWNWKD